MGKGRHLPRSFLSEDEAGRFIETHDLAEYDSDFIDADLEFDIHRETFLFPVNRRLAERIAAMAKRKRLPSYKLVARLLSRGISEEARSRS